VNLYEQWESGIKQILKVICPDPLSVQRLRQAIESENATVRSSTVRALGDVDPKWSVPLLVERLQDPESTVFRDVVRSLRNIEATIAIPFLQHQLDAIVHGLLKRLTDAVSMEEVHLVEGLLIWLGPSATSRLSDALANPDRDMKKAAARALGAIGDKKAATFLARALDSDAPQCFSEALANCWDEAAVPILIDLLSGSRRSHVRAAAATILQFLESLGTPE
jgi:HEAT repeat protein